MKKRFVIEVDIDTDISHPMGCHAETPLGSSKSIVRIRKDLEIYEPTLSTSGIAIAVAHEIGHVIGFQLGLPGNLPDPRMQPLDFSQEFEARHQAIINSEKEAWHIAELMFEVKEKALKSYENPNSFL